MAVTEAVHVLEHNVLVFRRIWRGSIMVSFFTPLFFLTAMGLGLGGLVNRGSGGMGGVPYIDYLAPGLLAATTMQTAAFESMYPILAAIMWDRIYHAMLATPLKARDIIAGEVAWLTLRLAMVASLFWLVMAIFGVVHSVDSLLVIPAATLNGLAFATPILAFTSTQRTDNGFSTINRFVITPLFLLGGTFFPIDKLPFVLQALAWATPLAHGVALCRGIVLADLVAGDALLHITVLFAYSAAGVILARPFLTRRLVN
jgi:lipooligosaccharide transport system permease protein